MLLPDPRGPTTYKWASGRLPAIGKKVDIQSLASSQVDGVRRATCFYQAGLASFSQLRPDASTSVDGTHALISFSECCMSVYNYGRLICEFVRCAT